MKKLFLATVLLLITVVLLTSCGNKSRAYHERQQEQIVSTPVETPTKVETPTAIQKGITTFTPEKVEVEPVIYNENSLIGESQTPGTNYRSVVYFITGSQESKLVLAGSYYNNLKDYGGYQKSASESHLEDKILLEKARECYKQIINSQFSDLTIQIEDNSGRVIKVIKKVPVMTEKKDGNAIIRQDSVIQLYPY